MRKKVFECLKGMPQTHDVCLRCGMSLSMHRSDSERTPGMYLLSGVNELYVTCTFMKGETLPLPVASLAFGVIESAIRLRGVNSVL